MTDPVWCQDAQEWQESAATPEEWERRQRILVGRVCISAFYFINESQVQVSVGVYSTDAGWMLTLERAGEDWKVVAQEYIGL